MLEGPVPIGVKFIDACFYVSLPCGEVVFLLGEILSLVLPQSAAFGESLDGLFGIE